MFRSPTDITSSESESDPRSDSDGSGGEASHPLPVDCLTEEQEAELRREIAQAASAGVAASSIPEVTPAAHSNYIYHTLLEQYCMTRAIKKLGAKRPGGALRRETDSDVVALGRTYYSQLSGQLGQHGMIGAGEYSDDGRRSTRQAYLQGLDYMLDQSAGDAAIVAGAAGTTALARVSGRGGRTQADAARAPTFGQHRMLSGTAMFTTAQPMLHHALSDTHLRSSPVTFHGGPLVHLPPGAIRSADLARRLSRYATEFREVGLLGQGGYGKVYEVVNHLDGQRYAVKKITLSPRRLKKLREAGIDELEAMLREIRTLACLEHHNVVRYFNGWVEHDLGGRSEAQHFDAAPARAASAQPDGTEESLEDGSERIVTTDQESDGICFGNSHSVEQENRGNLTRDMAQSIATVDKQSFAKSVGDEDDEVDLTRRGQRPSSVSTSPSDTYSAPGAFTDEPVSTVARPAVAEEPTMTLHIQMSLHPLSLSNYLSPDPAGALGDKLGLRHCFHVEPSLRLMLAILSGAEYLHSLNIVHRDLKPGNIFLSTHPEAPASGGCVDLKNCRDCDPNQRAKMPYVVPRIGDFGLVAKLAPSEQIGHEGAAGDVPSDTSAPGTALLHLDAPKRHRQVGTALYRPKQPAQSIDGKLDVFSLGVVMLELLCKFETSEWAYCRDERDGLADHVAEMERHTVLTALGEGVLPADLSRRLGDASGGLEKCIRGMVETDERQRWSCRAARECIERALSELSEVAVSDGAVGS